MTWRTIGWLLVGSLFATGCERKLMIGVVLPETGEAAVYGASIKTGVKLAFDEARAAQKLPHGLLVEYRDSGSDPARAASLAESLYKEGALAIIGGVTTSEAQAMIPIADRRERVLISPSASAPQLARMSVYFFRVYPSDDLEGAKAAALITTTLSKRRVLVVQEDNPYTRGLLPVFLGQLASGGGRVVGTVMVGEAGGEQKLRDGLTAYQPEVVYICGYGDAILQVLSVVRGSGYAGQVVTTSAINTATLLQRGGKLLEGIFFPLASVDLASTQEPTASFVKRYHQVYNLLPDTYAAHGYDAALALIYTLEGQRPRSGRDIQLRLKGLGERRGVTGPLAFDDYGNIKHFPHSYWIHDGKPEDYDQYLEQREAELRRKLLELATGGGQ
ncbi:MAG: ABC transporter substrate-binding protein [Thermoanaerobaculum sp.]|nr:ABC transporter substrate-binding protein [Thermoanaerobaculum sp.]